MRQVTLIALYGQKPAELSDLIIECQTQIKGQLGNDFKPYELSQIHATILGLERVSDSINFNRNFTNYRHLQKSMNFEGLLGWIRNGDWLPFQVQIGGFKNQDYPFTSRGQNPYTRSFSIQGDKVVIMGWPLRGEPWTNAASNELDFLPESPIYPTVLDEIRRTAQNFNILHAYHRKLTDVDNDFYFRIGLINPSALNYQLKETVENTVRQFLSKIQTIVIELTKSNLYIAAYEDETLPINSTQIWSLDDPNLTQDFIESLYE